MPPRLSILVGPGGDAEDFLLEAGHRGEAALWLRVVVQPEEGHGLE
jgi:hypothetical protein